ERLASEKLSGTALIPLRVAIPRTTVWVRGWPVLLTTSTVIQRADATLRAMLSAVDSFEATEWIRRLKDLHVQLWARGLFFANLSLDNVGVMGKRLVLLDNGYLTNEPTEIRLHVANEISRQLDDVQKQLSPGCSRDTRTQVVSMLQSI